MPGCSSFGISGWSEIRKSAPAVGGELALLRIIAFKFLQAVPVVLIISILAFLLLSLLPGDPAIIIAGEQASPEAVEHVRQQLGLDRPFLQQLAIWLLNLAQGNFGSSLILNQSVLSAVGERLPVTLSLAALSIAVTIPVGVFLGSLAAYYRQSWIDAGVMTDRKSTRLNSSHSQISYAVFC